MQQLIAEIGAVNVHTLEQDKFSPAIFNGF